MEILIGAIVIAALLFCMGVGAGTIFMLIYIALMIVSGGILMMFLSCLVTLIGSHKEKGVYTRTDKHPKHKFSCAYYSVCGKELANIFPCEKLAGGMYRADKEVTVRLSRDGGTVIDGNAFICIIAGSVFFAAFLAAAIIFFPFA